MGRDPNTPPWVQHLAFKVKDRDTLLAMLVDNQLRDCERSRRWSAAMVDFTGGSESNRTAIRGWIDKWMPLARAAIESYCAALPESEGAADEAMAGLEQYHRSLSVSG